MSANITYSISYIYSFSMQQKIEKLLSQYFEQSIMGKLFKFLSYSKGQSNVHPEYLQVAKWSVNVQDRIQILNPKALNKYIFPVPERYINLGYFKMYGFCVKRRWKMCHPQISKESPKQIWRKVWQTSIVKQFIQGNSDLLGLFLLLEASKQKDKISKEQPPVCWSSKSQTILINNYNKMKKFMFSKYKSLSLNRFQKEIYGFKSISSNEITHEVLNRNSSVEAWIIVFLIGKENKRQQKMRRNEKNRLLSHERRIYQERYLKIDAQLVGDVNATNIFQFLFDQSKQKLESFLSQFQLNSTQKKNQPHISPQVEKKQRKKTLTQNPIGSQKKKKKGWRVSKGSDFQIAFQTTKPFPFHDDDYSENKQREPQVVDKKLILRLVQKEIRELFKDMLDQIAQIGNQFPKMFKQLMTTFQCCSQVVAQDSDKQQ